MEGSELSTLKSYERVAKGLAYVPQGRMIFSAMTVKENIETGLVASGEKEVPGDLYELFPVLLEMKDRRGGNLSGGQQQQLRLPAPWRRSQKCFCWTSRPRAFSRRSSRRWRAP